MDEKTVWTRVNLGASTFYLEIWTTTKVYLIQNSNVICFLPNFFIIISHIPCLNMAEGNTWLVFIFSKRMDEFHCWYICISKSKYFFSAYFSICVHPTSPFGCWEFWWCSWKIRVEILKTVFLPAECGLLAEIRNMLCLNFQIKCASAQIDSCLNSFLVHSQN